jgi:hypothetical protein
MNCIICGGHLQGYGRMYDAANDVLIITCEKNERRNGCGASWTLKPKHKRTWYQKLFGTWPILKINLPKAKLLKK